MSQESSYNKHFRISEVDLAGNDVANYVHSSSGENHRIDVIAASKFKNYDYVTNAIEVFLPVGFPGSVTADYLPYQIYDSLQAFSSSIAGMIVSRAVLEGIGVGDSSVSPTSALLLSVLQDTIGRLATILFAHRLGTCFEPECKMYRFTADIFNDTAMMMDCMSPIFPRPWRLPFWCLSSVLRSMCGVAAGSSKASLSAHFATKGNLGELNAKDSSQETIISLVGMLAGSIILPYITSKRITWASLILLLTIHLGTNYLAVRSVCMRTFNRQRANMFFSEVIEKLHKFEPNLLRREVEVCDNLNDFICRLNLPSPSDISRREKIFERDGILRWKDGSCLGYCRLGVSLRCILDCFDSSDSKTGSFGSVSSRQFKQLLHVYDDSNYILHYSQSSNTYLVAIKSHERSEVEVHLKAWIQALYLAKFGPISDDEEYMNALCRTCKLADHVVDTIISCDQVTKLGWNLETSAMEIYPGTRFVLNNRD